MADLLAPLAAAKSALPGVIGLLSCAFAAGVAKTASRLTNAANAELVNEARILVMLVSPPICAGCAPY
jgi:hypothetical protein